MVFHSIVKHWCEIYKYMLHTKKNKHFYLTDSTGGLVELAKGITEKNSPCVVMESSVEGGGPITRIARTYPLYFFVKAKKMADGDDAAVAKEEAWLHATNFLAWLKNKHDEEIGTNRNGDFSRINLDDAFIDVMTIGPIENGWYAVLIQFEREEPLNMCIDKNLYTE